MRALRHTHPSAGVNLPLDGVTWNGLTGRLVRPKCALAAQRPGAAQMVTVLTHNRRLFRSSPRLSGNRFAAIKAACDATQSRQKCHYREAAIAPHRHLRDEPSVILPVMLANSSLPFLPILIFRFRRSLTI